MSLVHRYANYALSLLNDKNNIDLLNVTSRPHYAKLIVVLNSQRIGKNCAYRYRMFRILIYE